MAEIRKTNRQAPGVSSRMFAVFQEHRQTLMAFIRRISHNPQDVEDITQETILRALNAEKEREINEPKTYLFSIAKNIVRDELSKKSRSLVDFIEDFGEQNYLSDEPLIDEQVSDRQRMLVFWEAVSTLPEQCQRVFVMKKVYGYSHQEISKALGISISTTEKHSAAGLKRCAEYMDRYFQTGEVGERRYLLKAKALDEQ